MFHRSFHGRSSGPPRARGRFEGKKGLVPCLSFFASAARLYDAVHVVPVTRALCWSSGHGRYGVA
eukprot:6934670-Pyramimonas_sp.AAC.1